MCQIYWVDLLLLLFIYPFIVAIFGYKSTLLIGLSVITVVAFIVKVFRVVSHADGPSDTNQIVHHLVPTELKKYW